MGSYKDWEERHFELTTHHYVRLDVVLDILHQIRLKFDKSSIKSKQHVARFLYGVINKRAPFGRDRRFPEVGYYIDSSVGVCSRAMYKIINALDYDGRFLSFEYEGQEDMILSMEEARLAFTESVRRLLRINYHPNLLQQYKIHNRASFESTHNLVWEPKPTESDESSLI